MIELNTRTSILLSMVYLSKLFLFTFVATKSIGSTNGQEVERLRSGDSGNLRALLQRSDVEFYPAKLAKPFEDNSSVQNRYFVCMNSLSILVAIQTIKDAYPASFQILCSTRRPNSGVYQFQEVNKKKIVDLGINLDHLVGLQMPVPSTRHETDRLFQVSIHEHKVREFEMLMESLSVKKSSELTPELRLSIKK